MIIAVAIGCVGTVLRCLQFIRGVDIPSVISVGCFGVAGLMALCAGRCRRMSVNVFLAAFIAVGAVSIMTNIPTPEFQSWKRLAMFAVALAGLSPLLTSDRLDRLRHAMWPTLIFVLRGIAVGSAIRFIWIIAAHGACDTSLLAFRGITDLGMVLSPVCAIVALDSLWQLLHSRGKTVRVIYGTLEVASVVLMVCAGSRIAVAGFCLSLIPLLWFCRENLKKSLKPVAVISVCLTAILSAGWSLFGAAIHHKNMSGISQGSVMHSRTERWELRWNEFRDNPIIGVGFDVLPHDSVEYNNPDSPDYHTPCEPGSSWLAVLSMTGIAGAICIAGFITQILIRLFQSRNLESPLHLALFIFLLVNGVAEGWLTYAGGLTFMIFWLLTGIVMSSSATITTPEPKKDPNA